MEIESQRKTLRERGILHLPGFLPPERVTLARDVVLNALERQGAWRDGRLHLEGRPSSAYANAGADLVRGIKRARQLNEVVTPQLLDLVAALLDGRDFVTTTDVPQLLFTLPNATEWTVPHINWHLDVPRLASGECPGVQMFTFLDTVEPGGGGTLVVAGSHRLLNENRRIGSKDVKRKLKQEPYFRDLMSREAGDRRRFLTEPGRAGSVEVQVVELHGEAGDVFLTDLRLLHTLAPNVSQRPRMMLTQRFIPAALRTEIFDRPERS